MADLTTSTVYVKDTGAARSPQPNPMKHGEFLYRKDDVIEAPPSFDAEEKTIDYVDGSGTPLENGSWVLTDISDAETTEHGAPLLS